MIRNLVRRLILWSVPEAAAEGGETRPVQENQDTVKLVAKKYGYWRAYPNDPDSIEDRRLMKESWERAVENYVKRNG